jgi:hypothetical protein
MGFSFLKFRKKHIEELVMQQHENLFSSSVAPIIIGHPAFGPAGEILQPI